ncbi:3-phosphoglycerate dehydrogenase [Falsochrobactrum shanghaiense]|uniref:3-phosphoglycerate dehydrogenase n=2 Tax=Falsochrobactrum shanghaiense TaxID=2201899 RepID=A0A316JCD6_9HYPH|nr:3-phosphoglycerate dehydrogenase [Falsochrobactrum shanghaiense]
MYEMLSLEWPDHARNMKVYLGDMPASEIAEFCQDATVIWNGHTMMTAPLLSQLPRLKRILFLGSGPQSYIDMEYCAKAGIVVDRVARYGDRAVAEHALALMLASARRVADMDRALRIGIWDPLEGMELGERRLGLIGGGGIARSLAGMARALDMKVSIWNRSPLPAEWADCATELDDLLSGSDFISLHLSLNPQTHGFLSAAHIARMRPGAILINTARAGLIDTSALIAALKSGHLRHAGLDVFEMEPLPPDDPLLSAPNLTMTSHAGFKTREATQRLMRQAIETTRNR